MGFNSGFKGLTANVLSAGGTITNTLQKQVIVNQQACSFVYGILGYGIYAGHICSDAAGIQGVCSVCRLLHLQITARPLSQMTSLRQCSSKRGYTLVTLPRIVTPHRGGVDGTRDRVTYQKLVTR